MPLMIGHRHGHFLRYTRATLRKVERTSIRRSRFTIQPSIVHWATDLAPDAAVAILSYRSLALWVLGYPESRASRHRACAQGCARDRAGCYLMFALYHTSMIQYPVRKLRGSKSSRR